MQSSQSTDHDLSVEEIQMNDVEASLQLLEEKPSAKSLRTVKSELQELKLSIVLIPDPTIKTSIRQRAANCDKRIKVIEEKYAPSPGSAKSAFFANKDSTQILEEAHGQLIDAEKNGQETLEELSKQKEKINQSRNKLKDVQTGIKKGDGLLDQMKKWWRG